ncbi:MAG: hypothetical protein WD851_14495 [Pirellulales bacterium]
MIIRYLPLLVACFAAVLSTPTPAADDAVAESSAGETVEIFHCDFDASWDVNFDGWPDRWERNSGPGFPQYVAIGIADDTLTPGDPCLRIALDGASAEISSPPIRVLPRFSYTLDMRVRTEQVAHSHVTVEVDFLDAYGKSLQLVRAPAMTSTDGWVPIRLETMKPAHADIDRAVLRITTRRGERGDLNGIVWVDGVRLARLPSMAIAASDPLHIYQLPEDIEVSCTLRGIRQRNPEIEFQLLDSVGDSIAGGQARLRLDGTLIEEDHRRSAAVLEQASAVPAGYEGVLHWQPPIKDFGFYRVRVAMLDSEHQGELESQTITLAVLPPLDGPRGGEFGWTLPDADQPLSFEELTQLLPQLGVSWVKLPIWFAPDDAARGERLIHFADRLAASYIDVVGLITDPQGPKQSVKNPMNVADLFSGDTTGWLTMFDHVMTRLSLRVRWWQLGIDDDTSFVGDMDLTSRVAAIRKSLFRFGQDVQLGINWRWSHDLIPGACDFVQMSSHPALSLEELRDRLDISAKHKPWILIDTQSLTGIPAIGQALPPDNSGATGSASAPNSNLADNPTINHSASHAKSSAAPAPEPAERVTPGELQEARIRQLTDLMITAKIHGATGIYCPNPFTDVSGLMTSEGEPGELLLPWRTTASLLGGAGYLGQLELPKGSPNHVFRRYDGLVVMVVWNDSATTDHPVEETLFLGDNVQQLDIWGRPAPLTAGDNREVTLRVSRLPTYVLGLHEAITRWRINVAFGSLRVPSIFGVPHSNSLQLANYFGQGIGGTVTIFVPDQVRDRGDRSAMPNKRWSITPERGQFAIKTDGTFQLPLEIKLDEATYGRQPVRLDFELEADKHYSFSVWRDLFVGQEDIDIRLTTRLGDNNELVIEQWMANRGATPADFKCLLYAPPNRRKRTQVFMLGPEGDTKIYEYPKGKELVGRELKLRAEEVNGARTMIYRFMAEP